MKLEISCFFGDINDFCKILDFRIFSYGRGQKLTPEKPATGRRFRAFLQFFMGSWRARMCTQCAQSLRADLAFFAFSGKIAIFG